MQIPFFLGDKVPSCSMVSDKLLVQPIILMPPTVCSPFEAPSRVLGPKVCEITCIIEVLPVTSSTMMNFFKGPSEINADFAPAQLEIGHFVIVFVGLLFHGSGGYPLS